MADPGEIILWQATVTARTLQRECKRRRLRAGRYKMAKVKDISKKNKLLRVEYERRHEHKTVDSFWQFVHFTDEAHIDLNEY